ncbi:MAG: acyl-CoA dehydratase activase-related protein [Clostridia bacterium]|nr:acyl-CoA dehydratase activase-related protein [Clostridia bacterium]
MSLKIGMPRALLYHTYFPLWNTFFESLGTEVIISPQTNKLMLDEGLKNVVDETCLPVKIFFGHVAYLSELGVDLLFVPRIVSIEKKAYICPKFMGLPDMLIASKIRIPPLIQPTINNVKNNNLSKFLKECTSQITSNKLKIWKAWQEAWQEQIRHEQNLIKNHSCKNTDNNDFTILIIGHDYNIYDTYVNMDMIEKLKKMGCNVVTPTQISKQERDKQLRKLPRSIFWTYGRDLLGALYNFVERPGNKGVIILSSFGCGVDSFIDNMIVRRLTQYKIPYLNITLDEHTGDGGLVTRIEAFVDILNWRGGSHKSYVSSHG